MKLNILIYSLMMISFVYAEEVSNDDKILSEISSYPVPGNAGDWINMDYGNGDDLIRREIIRLTRPSGSEKNSIDVVGFVHIRDDGKSYVHSYAGVDKNIKILGFKEVEDVKSLDPTVYATEFGWKSSEKIEIS